MAKSTNQKLKMFYILDYLLENTDDEHFVTVKDIINHLESNGISAERKAIYSDIEELLNYGYDIVTDKKEKLRICIASRDFELAELKMLVDSVQAARFISESKSNTIIKKIEKLASKHQAYLLQRQVYIADRAKTLNQKIYYVVDAIHQAISQNKKISFMYYEYGVDKKKYPKNNGEKYVVSPYSLSVSDDNYYMIAHYPKHQGLSHFRIDRMDMVEISDETSENIKTVTSEKFDLGNYSKKIFQMYGGETETVKLLCHNSVINSVIDKFGENVTIIKSDEENFTASITVKVSPTFFAWIFTFSGKMKILGPSKVIEDFNKMLDAFR